MFLVRQIDKREDGKQIRIYKNRLLSNRMNTRQRNFRTLNPVNRVWRAYPRVNVLVEGTKRTVS